MYRVLAALFLLAGFAYTANAGRPLTNVDAVAIDAGHGDDPGGRRGDALENGPCVLVAMALKELIERENGPAVKTILTFRPDIATNQRERAFAANGNGAKVFVSIHGYPAKQQEPGIFFPYVVDEPPASWKNSGAKYLAKSALLAEKLRDSMESGFPGKKYFLGRAQLVTFYGLEMPAVAVEAVQFYSQPPLTPEYAAIIAEAIYAGLVEYGNTR